MIALSVDIQQQHLYALLMINHHKGRKPSKPKPIPRPGVEPNRADEKPALTDAAAEFLFRMLNPGAPAS